MGNKLVTGRTDVSRVDVYYVVSQTDQPALYAGIIAGTTKLPKNSFVQVVPTSGAALLRFTGTGTSWTTSFPVGGAPSTADVANALKAKTQIAALTAVSTADGSDPATTQALANALKVSVNAVIAALKA